MQEHLPYIRWFSQLSLTDLPLVGGKNAALGELHGELRPLGVPVPDGFAVTAEAYRAMVEAGGIRPEMERLLCGIDKNELEEFARRGAALRELLYRAALPVGLEEAILAAYRALSPAGGSEAAVAVRSSATAEDLPTASFAGQQESYLNIRGPEALIEACHRCFASLFTDRAIAYRIDQGFDHFEVALSIGIMRMVRSDLASSGVLFTLDTESGFRDVVLVTAAWGLGENVVQGKVNPDEYLVFKPTLETGHRPLIGRKLGEKALRMVYGAEGSSEATRNEPTGEAERNRFCLQEQEILDLAGWALSIERHFSERAGHDQPMDIEWAKDGESGQLFILQARPETVHAPRALDTIRRYHLEGSGELLAEGLSVGDRIASGKARRIEDVAGIGQFRPGEVLVTRSTSPDWEPVLKGAAAIVTDRGGRTCHAAIVSRELGIPTIVGTGDATGRIHTGQEVTVCCAGNEAGKVYAGTIPFRVETLPLGTMKRPRTKMMMNLGNPAEAFSLSQIPNDGVGLARMEFIISSAIRVHPMALLHPEQVASETERLEIERLVAPYPDREAYFVEKLSEGIATIAAAFYPKPAIVRLSDFKSSEYASLLGGRAFEPEEENPMLGFRGASRYYDERYREGFALECRALKRVREHMGLSNVVPMIPFCRTVAEGEKVLEELEKNGLKRGENGLLVYVMCEIPNNVIQIDAFSRLFDGFSIGSNDLTQLVLGVDRDSDLVAHIFDERDPGVLEMIGRVIEGARKNGRYSGICGQAPSDYPEFCDLLVACGIESISLNPDSILQATMHVVEAEAIKQHPARLRAAAKGW